MYFQFIILLLLYLEPLLNLFYILVNFDHGNVFFPWRIRYPQSNTLRIFAFVIL